MLLVGSAMKKSILTDFSPNCLFYVAGHTKVFLYVPQNLINLSSYGRNRRRYMRKPRKTRALRKEQQFISIFGTYTPDP